MTVLSFQRFPVAPGAEQAFEELAGRYAAAVRGAPGLLWCDLARAGDDDPSFLVLSEWRTPADADAWEDGDTARAFADEIDVHLRGDPTRRRFSSG